MWPSALGDRRFLTAAVALNFVVNPLLAWVLGGLFLADQPALRVGLVLFLVTPCIGWYLVFTELAGGDTNLGVSLLGVNVILQVALLPLYLRLFTGQSADMAIDSIVLSIVLYLLAPAGLAAITRLVLRRRSIPIAAMAERLRLADVKSAVLAAVLICMFAANAEQIYRNPGVLVRLIVPFVGFFVIAASLALLIGNRLGLARSKVVLLVFTITSRNSEASLAIAATAFPNPLVGLTVVLGPVIELPLLVLAVRLLTGSRAPDRIADAAPEAEIGRVPDSEIR